MDYQALARGEALYLIAEMSANHAGSLDSALAIVRAAKAAGADCLKIQTYTADTLTLDADSEPFRIRGGLWDGARLYDLYKEAGTPYEWHAAIRAECIKQDIDFLSTPFDKGAVDFLEELGVESYKIASFELVDLPLIAYAAAKGKPMLMSCGMATAEEIREAIETCREAGNEQILLLKCCSEYPADWADMNLHTIEDMRTRFNVPVGLSDHSQGSLAAIVGVSLGACVVEKHLCLSRYIENPDSAFSMEPGEYAEMAKCCRDALAIRGRVSYDRTEKEQASSRLRRSLFASADIGQGEVFTEQNLRSVRPANGIAPKYYDRLLGKPARRAYRFGEPITPDEVEDDG